VSDEQIIEAIATKVMRWVKASYDQSGVLWGWHLPENGYDAAPSSWDPLTDPAASKLVREKLAERFPACRLDFCLSESGAMNQFSFAVGADFRFDGGYRASGTTEERAVALCALRSVGVEV
jgi:hypothetical protein